MEAVRRRLRSEPALIVEVLDSPDDICAACPHMSEGHCARNGDPSEGRISRKDNAVLQVLGLAPGDRIAASELFALASERFGATGLRDICGSCRWFGFGWCEQGIRERTMLPASEARSETP